MKVIAINDKSYALVFDLDNTLYTNPQYAAFQEAVLVERLGRELGIGTEAATARVAALRAERAAVGLGKTSLGRIFAALGIEIVTSVRWREECIEPAKWLKKDAKLDRALSLLSKNFSLALMTNNPRLVGEKSLEALGVRDHFSALLGLDDTHAGKPAPKPFIAIAAQLSLSPKECISIGDRFDVDLAPAMEVGMGAILVEGVEDVYSLPMVFSSRFPALESGKA